MTERPHQSNAKAGGFSKLIVGLALTAVCVSVAVMILAVGIVKGYQHEVRNKIVGFHAPVQISHLDLNNSFESQPIERDSLMERIISGKKDIKFIQRYSTKAGIIKTEEAFEGIVLKGVDRSYNWEFIQENLKYGRELKYNDTMPIQEILISSITSNRLKLDTGDNVLVYFVQEPPRVRKLKVCGIFDTGMGELDQLYAFTDMRIVQKLNNWDEMQISGYEIGIPDITKTEEIRDELVQYTPVNMGLGTVFDLYPSLFGWLKLLDMNVVVVLFLMVAVAAINMITALLILIIERMQMIGLMKSMGADDTQISRIFLWMAARIISRGLLMGNVVGIGIALIQKYTGIVTLDPGSYYLSRVPVELHVLDLAWINGMSFMICLLLLLIPVRYISKIDPVKTIQFN